MKTKEYILNPSLDGKLIHVVILFKS